MLTIITFIIGNGFDLATGLKTSYKDFLDVYKKPKKDDSKAVKWFKTKILEPDSANWENWADFEWQMGQASSQFNGKNCVDDFNECVENFNTSFKEYLREECEKIDWDSSEIDNCTDIFYNSISKFYEHIKSVDSWHSVENFIGYECTADFVQFNYTSVFDKLLERSNWYLQDNSRFARYIYNMHIHGKMDGYITMGVDNVEQISNEEIRRNPTSRNIFVKSDNITLVHSQDVNKTNYREQAFQSIAESRVICVFGSSIGATDQSYWAAIGEWLKNKSGKLVIFDVSGVAKDNTGSPLALDTYDTAVKKAKRKILEQFANVSNLGMDWTKNNLDRIIIELDTEMFGFKFPMKQT